jgi:hypothetical protein
VPSLPDFDQLQERFRDPIQRRYEIIHIPPDLVVECVTAQRKPPEVRIWRLSHQSRVGTVPPSR